MAEEVRAFLRSAGLGQYSEQIIDQEGYDELATLAALREGEIAEDFGFMKRGHQKKLFLRLQALQPAQDQPPARPSFTPSHVGGVAMGPPFGPTPLPLLNLDNVEFTDGTPTYDIFMSHAGADKKEVLRLTLFLEAQGFEIFLDLHSIKDSIENNIIRGLASSRLLLIFMTQGFFQSKWACSEAWSMLVHHWQCTQDHNFPVVALLNGVDQDKIRNLGPRVDQQLAGLGVGQAPWNLGGVMSTVRYHKFLRGVQGALTLSHMCEISRLLADRLGDSAPHVQLFSEHDRKTTTVLRDIDGSLSEWEAKLGDLADVTEAALNDLVDHLRKVSGYVAQLPIDLTHVKTEQKLLGYISPEVENLQEPKPGSHSGGKTGHVEQKTGPRDETVISNNNELVCRTMLELNAVGSTGIPRNDIVREAAAYAERLGMDRRKEPTLHATISNLDRDGLCERKSDPPNARYSLSARFLEENRRGPTPLAGSLPPAKTPSSVPGDHSADSQTAGRAAERKTLAPRKRGRPKGSGKASAKPVEVGPPVGDSDTDGDSSEDDDDDDDYESWDTRFRAPSRKYPRRRSGSVHTNLSASGGATRRSTRRRVPATSDASSSTASRASPALERKTLLQTANPSIVLNRGSDTATRPPFDVPDYAYMWAKDYRTWWPCIFIPVLSIVQDESVRADLRAEYQRKIERLSVQKKDVPLVLVKFVVYNTFDWIPSDMDYLRPWGGHDQGAAAAANFSDSDHRALVERTLKNSNATLVAAVKEVLGETKEMSDELPEPAKRKRGRPKYSGKASAKPIDRVDMELPAPTKKRGRPKKSSSEAQRKRKLDTVTDADDKESHPRPRQRRKSDHHASASASDDQSNDAMTRIARTVGYRVLNYDVPSPLLSETDGSITFEGNFEDVDQLRFRFALIKALVEVLQIEICQIIQLHLTEGSIKTLFKLAPKAVVRAGSYLSRTFSGVPDFWKEPCIPWDLGAPDEEPEYDLFLSHNGVDKADVLILHIAFGALGFKTFLDLASIEGHIDNGIQSGLKRSRYLFAWITKHFFHSSWACREIWSFLKSRGVASVISYAVGVPVDEKEEGNIRTLGPRVNSNDIEGLDEPHGDMPLGYAALYQRIHKSVDVLDIEALCDVVEPFLREKLPYEQAKYLLILAKGQISLWDQRHNGDLGKVSPARINSAVEESKEAFRAIFPDAPLCRH